MHVQDAGSRKMPIIPVRPELLMVGKNPFLVHEGSFCISLLYSVCVRGLFSQYEARCLPTLASLVGRISNSLGRFKICCMERNG